MKILYRACFFCSTFLVHFAALKRQVVLFQGLNYRDDGHNDVNINGKEGKIYILGFIKILYDSVKELIDIRIIKPFSHSTSRAIKLL